MAANSKREQLLVKVAQKLGTISAIETVSRKGFSDFHELENYANTQLPVAVVLGGLPQPSEKFSGRTRKLDQSQSKLSVDIIVYALDNDTPDTTVSTLADDIWSTLYADMTLGLTSVTVLDIRIIPETEVLVFAPYVAFKITLVITYLHGKESI